MPLLVCRHRYGLARLPIPGIRPRKTTVTGRATVPHEMTYLCLDAHVLINMYAYVYIIIIMN